MEISKGLVHAVPQMLLKHRKLICIAMMAALRNTLSPKSLAAHASPPPVERHKQKPTLPDHPPTLNC